jgi:cation transporter-like permease
MKRFLQFLVVVSIIVGVVYATRSVRHQRARSIALPVVSELGGRVGSITAPFGGTEYHISFAGRSLTREDIDRLVVLNDLARNGNYVSVAVYDATISPENVEYMQQRLPEVRVLTVESDRKVRSAA